jgi:hypothetical protein
MEHSSLHHQSSSLFVLGLILLPVEHVLFLWTIKECILPNQTLSPQSCRQKEEVEVEEHRRVIEDLDRSGIGSVPVQNKPSSTTFPFVLWH